MSTGIRSYGPGKFDTILDSYVYSVSLDGGCDSECGSVDEGRWYGMLKSPIQYWRPPDVPELNSAERAELTRYAGVIVSECSQGFVSVEYFETAEALDLAWSDIEETNYVCEQCGESVDPEKPSPSEYASLCEDCGKDADE